MKIKFFLIGVMTSMALAAPAQAHTVQPTTGKSCYNHSECIGTVQCVPNSGDKIKVYATFEGKGAVQPNLESTWTKFFNNTTMQQRTVNSALVNDNGTYTWTVSATVPDDPGFYLDYPGTYAVCWLP